MEYDSYSVLFPGYYDNSFPIFRLTGTAPSGDIHPVVWANEEIILDAVVNNGVFLCLKPGYYHFSAALSSAGKKNIGVFIVHNTKNRVYARYLQLLQRKNDIL